MALGLVGLHVARSENDEWPPALWLLVEDVDNGPSDKGDRFSLSSFDRR